MVKNTAYASVKVTYFLPRSMQLCYKRFIPNRLLPKDHKKYITLLFLVLSAGREDIYL